MEHRLPLTAVPMSGLARPSDDPPSVLTIMGTDLVVTSVRPSATEREIVVRLYEPAGNEGVARLMFAKPVEKAVLTDLREHEVGELPVEDSTVTVPVDAFSILTLRVRFKEPLHGPSRKEQEDVPQDVKPSAEGEDYKEEGVADADEVSDTTSGQVTSEESETQPEKENQEEPEAGEATSTTEGTASEISSESTETQGS